MSTTPTGQTITPARYTCRSQLYRRHLSDGARLDEVNGSAVVASYVGTGAERDQAADLALADLSTLPRTGFKGTGAPGWIENQGARLPASPNRAKRQADGSLVTRLSANELLILSDLDTESTLATELEDRWSLDSTSGVYSLPRANSHCWLALTGKNAASTLAKVCGVDLRTHRFTDHEVAQTSLARVNAIIVRNDLAATPGFFVLGDVSTTEFLWDALLDAMGEFGGRPVGITALRALQADSG